jgi:hypothetical protein
MKLLDFPHKKRGKKYGFRLEETDADRFNKTVKEMRILLNKISTSNYHKVRECLIQDI